MKKYLLGYDFGSSYINAALVEIESGRVAARAQWPETEMTFFSLAPGFAEQNPDDWWEGAKRTLSMLKKSVSDAENNIAAVGISYQMHGLVVVDREGTALRPAIIWCDSRSVPLGEKALNDIGKRFCLNHFLNSPGNFPGTRLRWLKENEPDLFSKVYKMLLPGDYIACRMTGEFKTTNSGLSESILYDYIEDGLSKRLLSYFEIPSDMIPEVVDSFSVQGCITSRAANDLGLEEGIPVSYRSGDLPTNAFSLNAVNPGDVAAKTGMSGTIYAISNKQICDTRFRLSTFVHNSHKLEKPTYGIVHCVNGAGLLNKWLCSYFLRSTSIDADINMINKYSSRVGAGSDGLLVFPFGNGAERALGNINVGMMMSGLDFNKHSTEHIVRASQEGIIFAFLYGMEIMRDIGVEVRRVRATNTNLFSSPEFCEAFVSATCAKLEICETDCAEGAARAAGLGAGIYDGQETAFRGMKEARDYYPDSRLSRVYAESYSRWKKILAMYVESSQ
jgi:xylulokinase